MNQKIIYTTFAIALTAVFMNKAASRVLPSDEFDSEDDSYDDSLHGHRVKVVVICDHGHHHRHHRLIPHHYDCRLYYEQHSLRRKIKQCPRGKKFDFLLLECVDAARARCYNDFEGLSTPEIQTGKPGTQTAEPVSDTEEPATETEEPVTQTEEPATETEEPVTQTEETVTETEEPVTQTKEPVTETEELSTETEKPETEEPSTQTEDPETEEPTTQTEDPETEEPTTQTEDPETEEPSTQTEDPETEEPTTQTEEPETEEPSTQTEDPETEEPTTQAEEPETEEPSTLAPYLCPRKKGNFPDPEDCSKYYACRKGDATHEKCPKRMLFYAKYGTCFQKSVDCEGRPIHSDGDTTDDTNGEETLQPITDNLSAEDTTVDEFATVGTTNDDVGITEHDTCLPNDRTCAEDAYGTIFRCKKPSGVFKHPKDLQLFIYCYNFRIFIKKCPDDTIFSPFSKLCVLPYQ